MVDIVYVVEHKHRCHWASSFPQPQAVQRRYVSTNNRTRLSHARGELRSSSSPPRSASWATAVAVTIFADTPFGTPPAARATEPEMLASTQKRASTVEALETIALDEKQ